MSVFFSTVLLTLTALPALSATSVPNGYTPGEPWVGPVGVHERTADIMRRQADAKSKKHEYRIHRHSEVELVEYTQDEVPPSPPAQVDGPIEAASDNAQDVAFSFLGATLVDTLSYPPDSMGAAGPSQYIVAVNGRVRSFNKTTGIADGVINADTDVFFQSVMTPPVANNSTGDPRIRYDRFSGRWFIIMIDVPNLTGAEPNRIMIAVSDGPIITGGSGWTFYYYRHDGFGGSDDNGKFADYPTLGIDASALYIGVDVFKTRGQGTFDNTTAFVLRKSPLLSGGPIVVTAFRSLVGNGMNGVGPYAVQGVDNYDPSATEGYLIGPGVTGTFSYYDRLILRRISNPGGTPAISDNVTISIPLSGGTINVPHLGNTGGAAGNLHGLDFRLHAAHLRGGRLWTSQNIAIDNTGSPSGTDTRMGVRWYELQGIASGQTPSVAQSGTLFDSTPNARCYWMGTITVSGQGHAAMGFSVAGANDRINAGTAGRLKNDALGTMRLPILYTATRSSYNPRDINNNPINRWGDYSYTCVDPDDDMTMWTIQEFCNANNSYGLQIAKLSAPAPATPLACSPSVLTQGMANVNVLLTGMTDGDTGFFDPGAGFSNHIAAAVSGTGVTVNSVTYNNPTNLSLNLSISAMATADARTVAVTNPDGQMATSTSGILTIVPGTAVNQPPMLGEISDRVVVEEFLLSFTNSATDPNGNQLSYSLGMGAPTNATVSLGDGVFSWTPTEAQGPGTNVISVIVTDDGAPSLSATQSFTVIVLETNAAPVLAPVADRTLHAGSLLMVTNNATDSDVPTNILTYSLGAGSPPALLEASTGFLSWQTTDANAESTNQFEVIVSDNGTPVLSATQTFLVTLRSRPVIESIVVTNGVAAISWSALAGTGYQLEGTPILTNAGWNAIGGVTTATGNTASALDSASSSSQFYRVRVVP